MKITLDLDDGALTCAMETAPGKTEVEVINEALQEYARRRRFRGFLNFEGIMQWEGNLDDLRRRRPRPS